ncbi:FAD-dependent oxidoreductase [uncultured Microbulbifer sp.]|uniref:NAD(P)/FAD-dependent oxidoreductase n=1 Tax=uncultured Microbulbifer sp. TaxID=348147 RepID=UPI0026163091|nr:FAD-dependent oxidoreductase [uncultured Microbulbifer sp.]
MRIAIVGSGIAGLTAAYLLSRKHEITLFESQDRLGGHTATIDIREGIRTLAIDTGFIVYNDWTYPNFICLLNELGIESQPTVMGFSVRCDREKYEYAGNNLNTLFSQRSNFLSAGHWRMLWDIVRFNRDATRDWREGRLHEGLTLGEYLPANGYSAEFADRYLVPMGAAIWSASVAQMLEFSVNFFVRFFFNHGLLNLVRRPQWRVIKRGSRAYIPALSAPYADKVRLSTKVQSLRRTAQGVELKTCKGEQHNFDEVVLACHSDQALECLEDASELEQQLLGAIPYTRNSVVLHTDTALLPQRRRSWSSWNYRLRAEQDQRPLLTYNMNILQGLQTDKTYCVTLNAQDRIDPEKVLGRFEYAHPQFSVASSRAQQQWARINGVNRTWFCGAYWTNGFHEDGVNSALRVAEGLGVAW